MKEPRVDFAARGSVEDVYGNSKGCSRKKQAYPNVIMNNIPDTIIPVAKTNLEIKGNLRNSRAMLRHPVKQITTDTETEPIRIRTQGLTDAK